VHGGSQRLCGKSVMALSDRRKWNERYASGEFPMEAEASEFVVESAPKPYGRCPRALDLACGVGRNTLYLANIGYMVDAVDISSVGLEILRERVVELGLSDRVSPICVDLEESVPYDGHSLVVMCDFLDREIIYETSCILEKGAHFIVDTFLGENGKRGRYLLGRGELPGLFCEDCETIRHIEYFAGGERSISRMKASILVRKM